MRICDEPNIEHLRQKTRILEAENERLVEKTRALLRELLALKGMTPEQIELNLPLLLKQAAGGTRSTTRPGSEQRQQTEGPKPPRAPRKGHGPTDQLGLSVITEEVDLDEADKTCPSCGEPLEEWVGQEDESELVDIIERQWVLRRRRAKKYRCHCGAAPQTPPPEPRLIPAGRYTPDVAIAAAVDKYVDHLPLERQARRARRQGAVLTTQTLWDQTKALADLHEPLYQRIKEHVLGEPVIGADQSPFKYLKKGGSQKWQVWQLSCPTALYFEVHEAKSAEVGMRLLGSYKGRVVADGAKEFEALSREANFDLANCWSHARRTVLGADGEAPGQVAQFVDIVAKLYLIDQQAVRGPPEPGDPRRGYRHRIDLDKLRVLRDTQSRAVIAELHEWMLAQTCIPGGKLKGALLYVSGRWTALSKFLDDPRVPLDNNRTEAGYLGLAIGRRNYIGCRSEAGMRVAAIFYTLIESARVNGLNPEAYLRYATRAALATEPVTLPHEWTPRSAPRAALDGPLAT